VAAVLALKNATAHIGRIQMSEGQLFIHPAMKPSKYRDSRLVQR
jgi:hypothetical protein